MVCCRSALVSLLLATAQLSAQQEVKVLPDRWVFFSRNIGEPASLAKFQEVIDIAAAHGINGIVLNSQFDANVWNTPRFTDYLTQARQMAADKNIEIIPGLFSLGYGATTQRDPNLMEGLPVRDQLFIVKSGKAYLAPDPPVPLRNGGLEAAAGAEALDGWEMEQPGASASIDREVFHSGGSSVRFENFKAAPGRTVRIRQKVAIQPYRQYRAVLWVKGEQVEGDESYLIRLVGKDGRFLAPREGIVEGDQDWREISIGFNSWGNTEIEVQIGMWDGIGGRIWVDQVAIEEVGLRNVLRRPGTPVTVRSDANGTVYQEGPDYARIAAPQLNFSYTQADVPITLANGSKIREGERLRVSYYHGMYSASFQITSCLSEDKVYEYLAATAANVNKYLAPRRWFLALDEIRAGGTCDACKRRGVPMAQILADSVTRMASIVRALTPGAEITMWSDMFDPNHNAQPLYYLVDGDLTEVARLAPKDIRMMTWWNLKRVESLSYFNELGFKTLGAAYYDTGSLDNTRTWLAELNRTSGAQGIMYTTWASNYKDLAGFGDLVRKPPPPDPRVESVRLDPAALIGGATSEGNAVTLDADAGAGGVEVKLVSSDSAVATVPATVRVAEGARSASFSVATRPVADAATIEVSASTGAGRSAAQLAIMPANLAEFDAGDQGLPKDQAVTGRVTLDGPAPRAGAEIELASSNNDVLPLPGKVVIPAGDTSVTFTYTRAVVSEAVPVEIYAVYRGSVKKVSLTVQP